MVVAPLKPHGPSDHRLKYGDLPADLEDGSISYFYHLLVTHTSALLGREPFRLQDCLQVDSILKAAASAESTARGHRKVPGGETCHWGQHSFQKLQPGYPLLTEGVGLDQDLSVSQGSFLPPGSCSSSGSRARAR